jgi:type II secretory pathway predicted ATPase ExeA
MARTPSKGSLGLRAMVDAAEERELVYVCGHVDTGALHLRRSLASSNAGSYSACR